MNNNNIFSFVFCVILSVAMLSISYGQFTHKMPLINNVNLLISKKDRKQGDLSAYYKQSGTVFLLIGVVFIINAISSIVRKNYLFYVGFALATITIIYAIASSIIIIRKK